jgi:hypothetical protein
MCALSMFEPTWAKIKLFAEHSSATVMTEKLKFFLADFFLIVSQNRWLGRFLSTCSTKYSQYSRIIAINLIYFSAGDRNEDSHNEHDNSWLGWTTVKLYIRDHTSRKGESITSLLLVACILPGVSEIVIGMFGNTCSTLANVGSTLSSHVALPSVVPLLTKYCSAKSPYRAAQLRINELK